MSKKKIAIVMGGSSTEHHISLQSGCMILQEISSDFEFFPILVTLDSQWIWSFDFNQDLNCSPILFQEYMQTPPRGWHKTKQIPNAKRFPNCDLFLLALHGGQGEDGSLQAKLDEYGQKYIGSSVKGCQNAMNKIKAKLIYQKKNIPTPAFFVLNVNDNLNSVLNQLKFPLFLKDPFGGSSLGVYYCKNKQALIDNLDILWNNNLQQVLLEEALQGKEFSVGVVDGLSPLPVTEIIVGSQDFFTYKAKYTNGEVKEITPANITEKQTKELQQLALSCHKSLGLSMLSRTDFILDRGIFYAIETNNLPGMSKMSILPQQVQNIGLSYSKFISHIIEKGLQK